MSGNVCSTPFDGPQEIASASTVSQRLKIAQLLTVHLADANLKDQWGKTALDLALEHHDVELMHYMQKHVTPQSSGREVSSIRSPRLVRSTADWIDSRPSRKNC